MSRRYLILLVLSFAVFCGSVALAKDVPKASQGTVYVPASYQDSPFTSVDGAVNQLIVSRLFIRNTDMNNSISIDSVRFYGPDGELVWEFLTEPLTLSPLASTSFGANGTTLPIPPYRNVDGRPSFIVEWSASKRVNTPLIENARVFVQIELGGSSLHGLSITPGQQIR